MAYTMDARSMQSVESFGEGQKHIGDNKALLTYLEEYEALFSVAEDPHVLLQFSRVGCARCPAFTETVRGLLGQYRFQWAVVDTSEDGDLVEHFGITRLPAFVLATSATDQNATVRIAATPEMLRGVLSQHCERITPELSLDADF